MANMKPEEMDRLKFYDSDHRLVSFGLNESASVLASLQCIVCVHSGYAVPDVLWQDPSMATDKDEMVMPLLPLVLVAVALEVLPHLWLQLKTITQMPLLSHRAEPHTHQHRR